MEQIKNLLLSELKKIKATISLEFLDSKQLTNIQYDKLGRGTETYSYGVNFKNSIKETIFSQTQVLTSIILNKDIRKNDWSAKNLAVSLIDEILEEVIAEKKNQARQHFLRDRFFNALLVGVGLFLITLLIVGSIFDFGLGLIIGIILGIITFWAANTNDK
jgi:hypothetical protein